MANKKRTPELINFQKQQMSKAAMEIIVKEGYDSLSIRKLSKKLNISQSTIYNYFKNRDEIYIYVLNNGFEMLYGELADAFEAHEEPVEKLRRVCTVASSFAIRERDLAFIMLILDTPKYFDYLETDYEPFMRIELSNALKCRDVFAEIITEIAKTYRAIPVKDIEYRTIGVISQLIGFATIYNNNLLKYIFDDIDAVTKKMIEDIIQPFERMKKTRVRSR